MQNDLSTMRADTVFEEVDALPGSQSEPAVYQRDRELHLGERRFEMSRHVIGAFRVMPVRSGLRREAIEESLEVGAHGGVGVLLDEEGCRGVAAEDGEETGVHALLPHPLVDGGGALVEALAAGGDFEGVCCLLHTFSDARRDATGWRVVGCNRGRLPLSVSRRKDLRDRLIDCATQVLVFHVI